MKEPLAPVMPSWDVNLIVPLLNRSYSIGEIVASDTSLLRVGYGNVLSVASTSVIRPTYVGNSLSLTMQNINASMKLGLFGIAMPPVVSPIAIPGLPQGVAIPIPDTTFSAPVVRDTITMFESVTLVEGIMTLTFRNNLPVPVDVVGPVYMLDDANSVIATFEYNPATIQPNASRSVQDNLANKTIGSPQTVGNVVSIYGLTLHVHGSATPVLVPFGDMMVATISTSGLKARRAVNVLLPSQRLVNTDSIQVPLGDSTLIQEARIKSGSLNVTMHSTLDLDVMFKFQFKELLRPSGGAYVMYDDSVFIPRLGSVSRSIDAAGYRILSPYGNLLPSLEAVSTVIIPISGTQPITVNDTDKVSVTLTNTAPFVIDSAIAVVKPTSVNVNTVVALGLGNLPRGLSADLNIPSASLSLTTQSGIGFPLDLNVRFAARKQSGDSVFLDVPNSGRRVNSGSGLIQFDEPAVGQFLSQLFSGSLPDSIRISGKALVNPPDVYNPSLSGVGHIGSNSALSGKIDLQIPLTMGISNGMYSDTVAFGDTSGTGHGTFTGKDLLNDVNSGKMYIEVENRTPVKVDLALRLLNLGKQSLLTLPRPGQSVLINSAQVDADGNVVSATKSTIVLELSGADVQQFIPTEFVAYSLSFVSTPGAPVVKIRTTDGVKVRIWTNLSYRIN